MTFLPTCRLFPWILALPGWGYFRKWIPTLLTLGLGVLFGWMIFGKK
jgi:hypothetical protein